MGRVWRCFMRLVKVSSVTPLAGFRLDVAFSDGTRGTADLSGDLVGPLAPLKSDAMWASAHVRHGVVSWNDDLDIAPEFVYARAHGLAPPQNTDDVEANQMSVTMRARGNLTR